MDLADYAPVIPVLQNNETLKLFKTISDARLITSLGLASKLTAAPKDEHLKQLIDLDLIASHTPTSGGDPTYYVTKKGLDLNRDLPKLALSGG